jgi:hypothetical protein
MDGDSAGIQSSIKIASTLFVNGFNVKLINYLNDTKDIDEMINKYSENDVKECLAKTIDYLQYKANHELSKDASPIEISEFIKNIKIEIDKLHDPIVIQSFYN